MRSKPVYVSTLLERVLKNGRVYLAKDTRVEDSLLWVHEDGSTLDTYPISKFDSIDDFKDYITYHYAQEKA